MNNQVADSGFFQQAGFFLKCIQQKLFSLGKKNHSRMRKKSQKDCFALRLLSRFAQAADNLLMTDMHTVKRSGGYHGILTAFEFVDMGINFHGYSYKSR